MMMLSLYKYSSKENFNINTKFQQNPVTIQNSKKSHRVIKKIKSKVPMDEINVNAVI